MRRRRLVTVIMRRGRLTQPMGRFTQPTGRLTQPTGRLTQLTGRLTQLNQSRRNPIYLSRDLCGIMISGTADTPPYSTSSAWVKVFRIIPYFRMTWERSCSVVECLTRDREAADSSLTGVTVLWSLSKTHLS